MNLLPSQERSSSPKQVRSRRPKAMVVAGVMSGTSADGIDVSVCRIGPGRRGLPSIALLGHQAFPYPEPVRHAVLRAMAAETISVAELSRLNWRLGALYADAIEATCTSLAVKADLVGCHGQTLYHQAVATMYLGQSVRATWQTGEASVIVDRLRCPVVSDFRPADLAAGGQGAPLVPMLDAVLFRSKSTGRVLANLGGIANVTALPPGAGLDQVMAFDTGPGNMVMDSCMQQLYGRPFDAEGAVAKTGKVYAAEVMRAMRVSFFAARPPKSCGREEFGKSFSTRFIASCRKAGAENADIVATATALTSSSMVEAYEVFLAEHLAAAKDVEMIVAGGGAKNAALMGMLKGAFAEREVRVRPIQDLHVAAEAKEAMAFALLAWLRWWKLPGNLVGATGASRSVLLGKVSL